MERLVIGLVIGGVALLAACTQTLADEAVQVCYPLCRCGDVPLPAAQDDCTRGCIARFERNPFSDACVTCVAEHADRCPRLLDDCTAVCTQEPANNQAAPPIDRLARDETACAPTEQIAAAWTRGSVDRGPGTMMTTETRTAR